MNQTLRQHYALRATRAAIPPAPLVKRDRTRARVQLAERLERARTADRRRAFWEGMGITAGAIFMAACFVAGLWLS